MVIGYARVSTDDQDTAAQVAALNAVGRERIFVRRRTPVLQSVFMLDCQAPSGAWILGSSLLQNRLHFRRS